VIRVRIEAYKPIGWVDVTLRGIGRDSFLWARGYDDHVSALHYR
jgi:hypothetical protein